MLEKMLNENAGLHLNTKDIMNINDIGSFKMENTVNNRSSGLLYFGLPSTIYSMAARAGCLKR